MVEEYGFIKIIPVLVSKIILCIIFSIFFANSSRLSSNKPPAFRSTLSNPMSTQYKELLRTLYKFNIYNPVKLGLQNIKLLNEILENPTDGIPIIHVGGTNGKGSVCYKTAETCRLSGLTTGLFVSPHISSFRERVQVNGECLAEEDVITFLPHLFKICEENRIPATFFEITTALAFLKFQQAKCDVVVLEVGLGGRLDSTNIIIPSVSVITSVQLDHTRILGDTVERIAQEKGGIMKPNVPVLVGPDCPIHQLQEMAIKMKSPFFTLDDFGKGGTSSASYDGAEYVNTALAKATFSILKNSTLCSKSQLFQCITDSIIERGTQVRPPCRFEIFKRNISIDNTGTDHSRSKSVEAEIILDIAHNQDAMIDFVKKVRNVYGLTNKIKIVLGMSADKDVRNCLISLLELVDNVDQIYCVAARHPRAMSAVDLEHLIYEIAQSTYPSKLTRMSASTSDETETNNTDSIIPEYEYSNIRLGLRRAMSSAAADSSGSNRPLILVCGSAFIMSEARAELGIVEPKDGDILLEEWNSKTDENSMSSSEKGGFADAQEYFSPK